MKILLHQAWEKTSSNKKPFLEVITSTPCFYYILLINLSDKVFVVEKGLRIAQMVLCPVVKAKLKEVTELENTERGSGGFGSTGI